MPPDTGCVVIDGLSCMGSHRGTGLRPYGPARNAIPRLPQLPTLQLVLRSL
ncbi:MAG: hypothetical protein WB819_04895 [Terriglobia bacterium]|jgi:hypothetical protein